MRIQQLRADTTIPKNSYNREFCVEQPGWVMSITDYGGGMVKATSMEWKYRDPSLDERPRTKKRETTDTIKSRERAARRSRAKVYDAIMMIRGDRMMTLTYRENMEELDRAWKDFKRFVRRMREVMDENFEYVAVPERQKRGAWHFHVVLNRYIAVEKMRRAWYQALGGRAAFGGKTPGQVHVKWMGTAALAVRVPSVAKYLSKYITKHARLVAPYRRRYAVSRGIPCPARSTAMMRGTGDHDTEKLGLEYLFFVSTGRKPVLSRMGVIRVGDAGRETPIYINASYDTVPASIAGDFKK